MTDALDARREIDICQGRTTGERLKGRSRTLSGILMDVRPVQF
jgi:hypothetical protein